MARLSIIIPALGDVTALEETLVSVLSNRPADCEIIVPHAGTYDDPYDVGDEVEFIELSRRAKPGTFIARAVHESVGEIVHLLLPGCQASDGWCDAALAGFDDADVGSVSPALLVDGEASETYTIGVKRGLGARRIAAQVADLDNDRALEKSKTLGPTIAAAFYRRSALEAIGGWPTELSLAAADLDVALSLAEIGMLPALETALPLNCAVDVSRLGSTYETSRDRERLFWRHDHLALGVACRPIAMLAQCLLAGNPLRIAAAMLGKVSGCCGIGAARKHRSLIADAAIRPLRLVHGESVVHDDGANHGQPRQRAA